MLENHQTFLSSVLEAGDCSKNEYLAFFSLCLLRAIQINEGELEKIHQRKKWFAWNTTESYSNFLISP